MSSYLNFYLVPKKKEEGNKEQKPLLLVSYSRGSGIYQSYYGSLNPVYIMDEQDNYQYTELTKEDALSVVSDVKESLHKAETSLHEKINAINELCNLSQESIDNYVSDYVSFREYIEELKDTIKELQFISSIVSDISEGYTDFEKVLINID